MEKNNIRILAVDDDRDLLESYQYLLEVEGHSVVTALDSRQAEAAMQQHVFDVALVDLKIKAEDGLDLAGRLRSIDPLLQIVIITAFPSYQTAVRAMKLGAFDYLSKTSDAESVVETVEEANAQRELQVAEIESKGNRAGDISLTIICDNTLMMKGWLFLASDSQLFNIQSYTNNIPLFLKNRPDKAPDLIMLCATCNAADTETGIEEVMRLRQEIPDAKIVVFNNELDDEQMTRLLKIGVYGFFDRNLSEAETERFIGLIHKGETVAPRRIMGRVIDELSDLYVSREIRQAQPPGEHMPQLTEREKEIVRFIARGLKNKEIADLLFISPVTVKTHITHIFRKLGVGSRLQAVNRAYELNLVP